MRCKECGENLVSTLIEYFELIDKYGTIIFGCGCCRTPSIYVYERDENGKLWATSKDDIEEHKQHIEEEMMADYGNMNDMNKRDENERRTTK